jgi:hypothetical protein
MRAPEIRPRAPSTAAFPAGPADAIEVLGETLRFVCGDDACDVEATYRLRAREAVALDLSFILPSPQPVTARVGRAAAPVEVAAAPPSAVRDDDVPRDERMGWADRPPPVYQARMSASLVAGDNVVVVTYRQPLGQYERDHGYFSKGRFLGFFRYELWPLGEWKRAAGFRLDGDVAIHRPAPSWWQRTFSKVRSVGCRGLDPAAGGAREQRGDELHFAFHVTDPIPKRLWCFIGDDDLVEK